MWCMTTVLSSIGSRAMGSWLLTTMSPGRLMPKHMWVSLAAGTAVAGKRSGFFSTAATTHTRYDNDDNHHHYHSNNGEGAKARAQGAIIFRVWAKCRLLFSCCVHRKHLATFRGRVPGREEREGAKPSWSRNTFSFWTCNESRKYVYFLIFGNAKKSQISVLSWKNYVQ